MPRSCGRGLVPAHLQWAGSHRLIGYDRDDTFLRGFARMGLPLQPQLKIPPLPCWLAVHREVRGNPLVRLVHDHLAVGLGRVLG